MPEPEPLSIGEVRTLGEQRYELVAFRDYVRKDGVPTQLAVWQSRCARCGEPFCCTTANSRVYAPTNRRCDKHKRPGSRVKPRRQKAPADA